MSRPACLALALLALAAAGCSRTALAPECPTGYTFNGEKCVCSTNEGCPTGFSCEEAVCVCRDTSCCPEGFEYS
ncbi:MAG: hypothetical protein ACYC8T_30340, partial [Myxococcaceae bacterium]